MNLTKFVPKAVTAKAGRALLKSQKHSPTILFVAGVAGVVTTTVLACRATLKLDEVLAEAKENLDKAETLSHSNHSDYSTRDYKQDVTYIYIKTIAKTAKLYAPAVAVGALSVACLTGSHVILTKRNVALTSAYAALEKGFKEYRERVTAEYGPEKERELRYSVEKTETVDEKGKKHVTKNVGPYGSSVYARFFDEYCKSWNKEAEYNLLFLKCQQQWANDLLQTRGHVFLNEIYDMLGIDRSKAGQVVGWVIGKNGDNYIDFGIFDKDRETARNFVNGRAGAILLDFNVDGVIYDKI